MNPLRIALASSLALLLAAAASAAVETYKIDPVHSSVGFKIRNFFTPVPGSFTKFDGTIIVDRDNLEASSAEATIEAASINTANQKRDDHLRSSDFFEAEKFPALKFKSTSWKKTGENTFDVAGDLTIKGITKPVTLKVTLHGFGPGARPEMAVSGWEATARINRKDFGITYGNPGPLDADVNVSITIQAVKQT